MILFSAGTVATAVHLENQDEFCDSCHTEPEVTYVERALASEPTDLASAHAKYEEQVRCIDCHSGYGTGGRILALYQGAEDLAQYLVGDYHDPAITTNPLGDDPCLKCHIQPSRDDPIDSSTYETVIYSTAHYHWREYTEAWLAEEPNPNGVCGVCHISHAGNIKAGLGFRYVPSVNETCDACHLALSGQTP
jgi:hypothetical protein